MPKDAEREQKVDTANLSLHGYNSALEKFSQSVAAFMEQMHHLSDARNAYQQAIAASAELRKLLDAGDEKLVNLMCDLEQAIDVHLGRQTMEKKKPERIKVEPINGNGDSAAIPKAMP